MGWIWSILVLSILIFVHEFGHFIVAKWCGVGVVKFSIGFGPAILRFRRGETVYQLSCIPLGGYVRMVGDMPDVITGPQETDAVLREDDSKKSAKRIEREREEEEIHRQLASDRRCWFMEKSLGQRSAIVFAGPLFNFLLAIFLIFTSAVIYGEDYLIEQPIIGRVMKDSPAAHAGLMADDRVISIDNNPIPTWAALAQTIHDGPGENRVVRVERGGVEKELLVSPQSQEFPPREGETKPVVVYMIGIEPKMATRPSSVTVAASLAFKATYNISAGTLMGIWGMIRGEVSPKELAGPLFIFEKTADEAEKGWKKLMSFMALISISLAVLNLLPIPVLDGGHLLFFLIEALIGPISIRKKEIAQQVGVALLLMLMVFAIKNDLTREPPDDSQAALKWKKPVAPIANVQETVPEPQAAQ